MISEMFNAIKECFLIFLQLLEEIIPTIIFVLTAAFVAVKIQRKRGKA